MAAPTNAEQGIYACQVCGKEFERQNVRIPAYRDGFRFECLECFQAAGGVTWIGKIPKYEVVR